jgi:hypothetical protein
MGVAGVGYPTYPTYPTPAVATPTTVPVGANWLMVPRCSSFKFEKCQGGFKVTCVCDDKVAGSMVQNLCSMLAGGVFSCCAVWNGMPVCYYNFTYGLCKYETVDNGVCVTCTSGDPQCASMIQHCCECLVAMVQAGCTCFALVNNTPFCCGGFDSFGAVGKTKK